MPGVIIKARSQNVIPLPERRETDRLMEELNILRLEGMLFCFDPKEAKRRQGRLTLEDARKHPLTVEIHPSYGQPSVLAYKVLQAIFLKLTEEGCAVNEHGQCLYDDTVSFSQRELALLVGRSWSGRTSQQLYDAVMQLQRTAVVASLYDKEADAWEVISFYVLPTTYFAGRGETITRCSVQLHSKIVASLNRRHVAFFNLHRLNMLETLGLVLYKRVFFHLSNLNHPGKGRTELKFTKDYEAICREWLGGLKPRQYKSDILTYQLGRHLDGLKATGLIRRYALEKNAEGTGFNLTLYPGEGFFEDYALYYLDKEQPRLRFRATADRRAIQQPLELVAYFHRQLGRTRAKFEERETSYADELLERFGEAEVRDLIDYAVGEAPKTKFEMAWFGALKLFLEDWVAVKKRRLERQAREEQLRSCPHCNAGGFLELRDGSGSFVAHPCPHNSETVQALRDRYAARSE